MSDHKEKLYDSKLKSMALVTMILLLIQIILGTQVRQQIDDISKAMNFMHRDEWISKLNTIFYIHRTFSIIIAAFCIYLFIQYRFSNHFKLSNALILFSVVGNILLGFIMASMNIPAFAQPAHLMLSSILLTAIFYNWSNTESVHSVNPSLSKY